MLFGYLQRRTRKMRTGFTLIEILVAVMISAALLLSADIVFEQVADSRAAASRAAAERDQTQNAAIMISRLVRQVDVSSRLGSGSTMHAFTGDSVSARFTSSCIAPGGWERECDVSLHVTADSTGAAIVAVSSTGDSARFRVRDRVLLLGYLTDATGGGHWIRSWPAGPTVPIAIGVMSPMDTVIWRIGARG